MSEKKWDENLYINDIAIIGMNVRLPGVKDLSDFWNAILSGKELIASSDENTPELGNQKSDRSEIRVNTQLAGIELFDEKFFGFTKREAELMDPQHRLFMESVWESLEISGYNSQTYEGVIGLYAGTNASTYLINNLLPNQDLLQNINEIQIMIGNDKDHLTSQIAYRLDLKGPCITVQTACSTSLVAVHLACESLLNGECDLALAGGVTIKIPQLGSYRYNTGGLVSLDGHCRTFDTRATGTVYSNGIGVVVLKRLNDALQDGDHIHAVIKGSAVNSDGSDRVGYTAPGVNGQISVITEALEVARIDPVTIGYVESHGTGTPLGDVIEFKALAEVYSSYTDNKGFCALSSIKPNIGHTEMAAGVIGLIKAALSVEHALIPPEINFEEPNPNIDWYHSPFYINTLLAKWENTEFPRRAGVSAFGLGGTNAHVVIEEAPQIYTPDPDRQWDSLLISARTESALKNYREKLANYLNEHRHISLSDVAYTLKMGRRVFKHKCAIPFKNRTQCVEGLLNLNDAEFYRQGNELDLPTIFVFNDRLLMEENFIRDMYQQSSIFKYNMDQCCQLIRVNDQSVLDWIWSNNYEDLEDERRQKLLLTVQYVMAQVWMDSGVIPSGVYGIGVGHLAAAAISNTLSLDSCFQILSGVQLGRNVQLTIVEERSRIPFYSAAEHGELTDEMIVNWSFWKDRLTDDHRISELAGSISEKMLLLDVVTLRDFQQQRDQGNHKIVKYQQTEGAKAYITDRLNACWLSGGSIDWKRHYSEEQRLRVSLPTYPFDRERHWIESPRKPNTDSNNILSKEFLNQFSREGLSSEYLPPSNEIEKKITAIWEVQLGISPIGMNDNFFELGGYSLLGTSLVTRINSTFSLDLYLRDLFENPTVSQLAECIMTKMLFGLDDDEFNQLLQDIE